MTSTPLCEYSKYFCRSLLPPGTGVALVRRTCALVVCGRLMMARGAGAFCVPAPRTLHLTEPKLVLGVCLWVKWTWQVESPPGAITGHQNGAITASLLANAE